MRFERVLLVSPDYPGSHYKGKGRGIAPPVGLGYVAEILKANDIEYEIIDFGLGYDINYLMNELERFKPEAVGMSMMTFRYKHLYTIFEQIKSSHNGVTCIAGGPHITAWKEKVLEQCSVIDIGVSGEGEYMMLELCRGDALSTIKGLIHRESRNGIVFNGEREWIKNLDDIPFPKYDRFELEKYSSTISINTSRGCPYQCIYCQSKSMLGEKWRGRSAKNIAEEFEYWYERGYQNFTIVDDNFTLKKERVYQLCDELERGNLKVIISAAGIRADKVDRDLLKRMKEVGFKYLGFGVEAGNNRILNALKKNVTIERIEQSVRDATELGYEVKLYFLVGSPYETLEDVHDSIDFALKYPIVDVNFGSLMPIPDTELIDWVRKEGRLLSEPEEYLNEYAEFERVPLFDGPGMSLKERKYALELTEKIRIGIKRRAQKSASKLYAQQFFAQFGIFGPILANLYVSKVGSAIRYILRHLTRKIRI